MPDDLDSPCVFAAKFLELIVAIKVPLLATALAFFLHLPKRSAKIGRQLLWGTPTHF
jgi:hypothetical protein